MWSKRSLSEKYSPLYCHFFLSLHSRLVDILYEFLSANRLSLGGALDGIIAAKRMDMSKSGKETCSGESVCDDKDQQKMPTYSLLQNKRLAAN